MLGRLRLGPIAPIIPGRPTPYFVDRMASLATGIGPLLPPGRRRRPSSPRRLPRIRGPRFRRHLLLGAREAARRVRLRWLSRPGRCPMKRWNGPIRPARLQPWRWRRWRDGRAAGAPGRYGLSSLGIGPHREQSRPQDVEPGGSLGRSRRPGGLSTATSHARPGRSRAVLPLCTVRECSGFAPCERRP